MAGKKEGMSKNLYAVIMAGGKGTRFWPLSREAFPKQFLKIVGQRTLLQDTIDRIDGLSDPGSIFVVTTKGQKDIVEWQVKEMLGKTNSIVEPEGKNTAPAIALVAFKLFKKNKNAILLVLPSDHFVKDPSHFIETMKRAVPQAQKGRIITFGIKPSKPETGYGYIKAGKKVAKAVFDVARFVEKPNLKTAKGYLKDGSYYWNSGMFMFRAKDMIEEMKEHMPDMHSAFSSMSAKFNTKKEEAALAEVYATVPEESIDYGIMEKSKRVTMVEADFHWSDIGSWSALEDVMDRDKAGNIRMGNVVDLECKDSIIFTGERLVAAIGLQEMVVVDTADATLIAPKDKVQDVKKLVARLKKEGKEEYLAPSIEERPWGYFCVLEQSPSHKIKHIYLKPKAKLSHQMHNHRSEHWIVVSGTAKVYRGEEVFFVHTNESTFIPATVRHSLENPGLIPLKIIEIQSGQYLGEDDIIRFDDIYGRSTK
jgi:mannose-1-phosphate guanylyltransferase/mannose-6-phosphate isomerase